MRLPMNLVEFDDSPARLMEPLNHVEHFNTVDGDAVSFRPSDPLNDGSGLVAGFEFFDVPPFRDVHEFGLV